MRQRVGLVIELVDVKRAGQLVGQALGVILVIGGMALVDVGAGQHHLGTQRAQVENLLAAHFVRHHQDQRVAFLGGDQRQAETGIPRRRLNNRAARLQLAGTLRFVNHRQRNAILNRAARILVFQLQEQRAGAGIKLVQLDKRGTANQFGDGVVNRHDVFLSGCHDGMIERRNFRNKEPFTAL